MGPSGSFCIDFLIHKIEENCKFENCKLGFSFTILLENSSYSFTMNCLWVNRLRKGIRNFSKLYASEPVGKVISRNVGQLSIGDS